VRGFVRSNMGAWCSHDPSRVAVQDAPSATIAINGGEPSKIDVVITDETVEHHWIHRDQHVGRVGAAGGLGSPATRSGRSATTASSPAHEASTTRPRSTATRARCCVASLASRFRG